MKNRSIIPTQVERVMRENDFIVSKTDLTGRIIYGNQIFQEFAAYSEKELIGSQHNIIRHPDMPRAAFKQAWDTIQSEHEFFAYVKNMAKDGSFYWVFTHITPSYDERGKVIGYLSVRRKPRQDAVNLITDIYKTMSDIEKRVGSKEGMTASTQYLLDLIAEKGTTYEQLILSLQG